ncbi:MAG: site-specific integrase [Lachnospiraceae bacterium]|nr:site-specific integrase [Lachnospiraceae bacterium]
MSNAKRRDNKGRVLQMGENQLDNGRYVYRYTTPFGQRKTVYSWRLTASDPMPAGKRKDKSLREKIKEIEKQLRLEICCEDITVCELVEKYISTKTGVKQSTQTGYKFVQNILAKEPFGQRKIASIKTSDAKIFLINMQKNGRGYSTIHTVRGVLRPAFQMAADDDMIVKNPFQFELHTVVVNDSVKRDALTREQERKFLQFIMEDNHYSQYYDAFYILFKTGLRISEFCGLTMKDIDFNKKVVKVNHQLQRTSDMRYICEKTKTENGVREVPMTPDVVAAFKRIIKMRPKPKIEPVVDGYSGFLFLDKNGKPKVALHWEKYFQLSVEKYNSIYRVQLPKITPHVCRHTFCTNMAKSGMNPKVLQYIMGHGDISVTLDTYTHIKSEDAIAEMERLDYLSTKEA